MVAYKKLHFENWEERSRTMYDYLNNLNLIHNDDVFYTPLDRSDFFGVYPEIKPWLNSFRVGCQAIGLIKIFENKVMIHQDNSALKGGSIRINWPVLNCENSQTIFYDNFTGIKETKTLANGTVYHEYKDEDCKEISRFVLDSPSAIDVSIPHRVICDKFPRIAVTFHLVPNPKWLLE